MIDFIKIKVVDANTIKYFKDHHLLYLHTESDKLLFDMETITTKNLKQYNGLLFEFTLHALYIYFKPHYYFNDNLHNANDFSVLNCIKTLNEFLTIFTLDIQYLEIINIEFALNIIIPKELICVKDLLAYLIYHERNEFYTDRKYNHCRFSNSTDKKGKANVYKVIKAYAKGIQFPKYTDRNTFRFEVKSNRKEYIKNLGINTLKDLLNPNIYNILISTIIKEFNEVLIIDDQAIPNLSSAKLKNHNKRLNPIHWRKLLNKSKNTFRHNVYAYNEALSTCETHLKKELKKLIFDKLLELKMCAYLTALDKRKICADLNIYIIGNRTQKKRVCPITGITLEFENGEPNHIRTTTLKHLERSDYKTYDLLRTDLLGKSICRPKYESSEISHMYKQIRNRYHNLSKIKQQGYNQKQYQNQLKLQL